MDKKQIDKVLSNQANAADAKEVAHWFGTPEGQLDLSARIDTDWEAMTRTHTRTHTDAPVRGHKGKWGRRIARVAAAIVLLLAGGAVGQVIVYSLQPEAEMREVYTQRGEQLQVMLPDGTKVHLNSGSRLTFPSRFGAKQRAITLIGEAYFEVTKDKHHPFVVELQESSVQVLGTRFNVSAYADEMVRVALDEGKVRFCSDRQEVTMKPGELLCYSRDDGRLVVLRSQDTHLASAWKAHRIEVHDMPLKELTNLLARRYDVTFAVQDEACYENLFSLSMSDDDLRAVINNMVYMSPIKAQYDTANRIVTISKRN